MEFEPWKKSVDRELERICGLDSEGMADVDYWSLWKSGLGPRDAAEEALRSQDVYSSEEWDEFLDRR